MKKLFCLLFLVGCVGNATPRNPMNKDREPLWWQKNTATMESKDNPWEIYVRPPRSDEEETPAFTFPKDFQKQRVLEPPRSLDDCF